ncbi:hypothetical protein P7K49_001645, partial [Saguinus oedipus]
DPMRGGGKAARLQTTRSTSASIPALHLSPSPPTPGKGGFKSPQQPSPHTGGCRNAHSLVVVEEGVPCP